MEEDTSSCLGHAVHALAGLEQRGGPRQQLGVFDAVAPARRGRGGEAGIALLLQASQGAGDGALVDAVGARELGLGGEAEAGEAGQAEVALALVVHGVGINGVGVEEVEDAAVVQHHAEAVADGGGVAGLEGEAGGQAGRRGGRGWLCHMH